VTEITFTDSSSDSDSEAESTMSVKSSRQIIADRFSRAVLYKQRNSEPEMGQGDRATPRQYPQPQPPPGKH
jgi:hypothetical protein